MDKKARFRIPVVGGSSLLVIFAVLCLTVLALLSLNAIQADGRLSQAAAQNVAAFYEADTRAEEIFARLRNGEIPTGVTTCNCEEEGYAYTCPISETQQLCVELHREGDTWTVLRWQAESIAQWENDESLHVWDGT